MYYNCEIPNKRFLKQSKWGKDHQWRQDGTLEGLSIATGTPKMVE